MVVSVTARSSYLSPSSTHWHRLGSRHTWARGGVEGFPLPQPGVNPLKPPKHTSLTLKHWIFWTFGRFHPAAALDQEYWPEQEQRDAVRGRGSLLLIHTAQFLSIDVPSIRGLGKNPWGVFCLYLYVISFDFDSGVGIPVTLTFWPGGGVNTLANPPPSAHAWCRGSARLGAKRATRAN